MSADNEIINRWTNSAPFWEKHHATIRQMFAPITGALVADAQICPRQTVLDVATGPGEPALTVANVVGSEGKIFGVDPIPEMIAGARRAADRLQLKNASFEIAFADHLPFRAATFDAAICRFGVMFFPSPLDGIREMLRVLKPAAKLAMAVWAPAESNPFHCALSQIVDRYVEPVPPAPGAFDAFRFAAPGKLLDIFSQAGVAAPLERTLHFKIEAPLSVKEFWDLRLEMSEVLRERIATLSAPQKTELKKLALEAFRNYSTDRGLSFPAEVLILSGSKSNAAQSQ
jgi:SAM-dependent methyltransferase